MTDENPIEEPLRSSMHPSLWPGRTTDLELTDERGNDVYIGFATTFDGQQRVKCLVNPSDMRPQSEVVLKLSDAEKLADAVEAYLSDDLAQHPRYYYDAVRTRNRLVTVSAMASETVRYIVLCIADHAAWLNFQDARHVIQAIRDYSRLITQGASPLARSRVRPLAIVATDHS